MKMVSSTIILSASNVKNVGDDYRHQEKRETFLSSVGVVILTDVKQKAGKTNHDD